MFGTKLTLITTTFALVMGLGLGVAQAHDENMKVLEESKGLKKAMKDFSKGVGVKCTSCHVKKDWDSEEKPMKDKSRAFFRAVVGEKDQAKRDAALADLLKMLEKGEAKDPALVWKGVDKMKRKAD